MEVRGNWPDAVWDRLTLGNSLKLPLKKLTFLSTWTHWSSLAPGSAGEIGVIFTNIFLPCKFMQMLLFKLSIRCTYFCQSHLSCSVANTHKETLFVASACTWGRAEHAIAFHPHSYNDTLGSEDYMEVMACKRNAPTCGNSEWKNPFWEPKWEWHLGRENSGRRGEEGYSVYLLEQANQHRQAVALISQLWQWTFLQH